MAGDLCGNVFILASMWQIGLVSSKLQNLQALLSRSVVGLWKVIDGARNTYIIKWCLGALACSMFRLNLRAIHSPHCDTFHLRVPLGNCNCPRVSSEAHAYGGRGRARAAPAIAHHTRTHARVYPGFKRQGPARPRAWLPSG